MTAKSDFSAPASDLSHPTSKSPAFDYDLVQTRGAEQERALDANPIGCHAADGDVRVVATLAHADDDSFEFLDALAVAFLDFDVDADGIAGAELGEVRAEVLLDELAQQRVLH